MKLLTWPAVDSADESPLRTGAPRADTGRGGIRSLEVGLQGKAGPETWVVGDAVSREQGC